MKRQRLIAFVLGVAFTAGTGLPVGAATSKPQTKTAAQAKPKPPVEKSPPPREKAEATLEITLTRFLQDRDSAKAREGFLQAIQEDPTYAMPCYNLGLLAESEEDWSEATKWFEEFRKLDQTSKYSVTAQLELERLQQLQATDSTPEGKRKRLYDSAITDAKSLLASGDLKAAVARAGEAVKMDDTRWEAYGIAATALSEEQLFEDAASLLRKALERAPHADNQALNAALDQCDKEVQYRSIREEGTKLLKAKDYKAAAERFRKAWDMFPTRGDAGLELATAKVMQGEYQQAEMDLMTIRRTCDPDSVEKAREMTKRLVLRRAGTLVVSQDGKGDFRSIAEAVKAAKPGSVISVRPGTYTENAEYGALVLDKPVSVIGVGGTSSVKIGAEKSGVRIQSSVVEIQGVTLIGVNLMGGQLLLEDCDVGSMGVEVAGNESHAVIRNCKIHGGHTGVGVSGGASASLDGCEVFETSFGIMCDGSQLQVTGCKVYGNKYDGICVNLGDKHEKASVSVQECKVFGNEGDGVFAGNKVDMLIRNCTIRNNQYGVSGYGADGHLSIGNCDIHGNTAVQVVTQFGCDPIIRDSRLYDGEGEGFRAVNGGKGRLEQCDIYGNGGPGVRVYPADADKGIPASSAEVRACKIHDGKKAGILVDKGGQATIEGCDIYANAITGIEASNSNLVVRGSTIYGNKQGGIYCHDKAVGSIESCEVYNNGLSGMFISLGADPVIRGCQIHGNVESGIFVYDGGKGKIEACDIFSSGKSGIESKGSGSDPTFTNCTIRDSQTAGAIFLDGASGTLDGCRIFGNALAGADIWSDGNPTIRNCKINRNHNLGVFAHSGASGRVEDCDLTGNKAGSIEIDATSRLQYDGKGK